MFPTQNTLFWAGADPRFNKRPVAHVYYAAKSHRTIAFGVFGAVLAMEPFNSLQGPPKNSRGTRETEWGTK